MDKRTGLILLLIIALVVGLIVSINTNDQVEATPTKIVPTEVQPTATVGHTVTSTSTPAPTATCTPTESAPTHIPTPTPFPTSTPTPTPTSEATPAIISCVIRPGIIYVIERGDTLWHIADCAYGHPLEWPDIYLANPQLSNPGLIHAGNPLIVPGDHEWPRNQR